MVARGKCERSEHDAPGSLTKIEPALKVRYNVSVALVELSRFPNWTRGYAQRGRPWLPYFAPSVLPYFDSGYLISLLRRSDQCGTRRGHELFAGFKELGGFDDLARNC